MSDMIPTLEDPNIETLIDEIRKSDGGILPNASPIIVAVKSGKCTEINNCFPLVNEKIQKCGGERVLGWTLRKETTLMSAEFHSVWKSPQGELLDITPKGIMKTDNTDIIIPTNNIMFVAAPYAKYEGKQVCNIYINISGNPLADDIIHGHKCIFNIQNKGERAYQYGKLDLTKQEIKDSVSIQDIGLGLMGSMANKLKSRKDLCFCGSDNKYKHCHQKILRKIIKRTTL